MADPLAYWRAGFQTLQNVTQVIRSTDPTVYDTSFPLNQEWLNELSGACWKLTGRVGNLARWEQVDNNAADLLDGQLQIGVTGSDPQNSTLSAGDNITITNGAGSITISAANPLSPQSFSTVTSSIALVQNRCYYIDALSAVDLTLPTTMQAGYVIEILGRGALWTIKQNAGQMILFNNSNTTTGPTGELRATDPTDCVTIRCVVDNLLFIVHPCTGNLDLT